MAAMEESEAGGMMAGFATAFYEDGTSDPLDTNEDRVVNLSEIIPAAPASDTNGYGTQHEDASNQTVDTAQQADSPEIVNRRLMALTHTTKLLAQNWGAGYLLKLRTQKLP